MLAGPRRTLATSLLLRTASRLIFPLLLLFALFLLLRGHNEPGGSFTGGLVATTAVALQALGYGAGAARKLFGIDLPQLIGVGLLIALAGGVAPVLAGMSFLDGWWGTLALPGGLAIELGTPLLFEVGVYLVVFGVTSLVMLLLAEIER